MKTAKLQKIAALAVLASMGMLCLPATAGPVLFDDEFISKTTLKKYGDKFELDAMRDAMDDQSLVLGGKADATAINNGNGQFYIDLMLFPKIANKAPGYFMLKFGDGNTGNAAAVYFYKNLFQFDKLVFRSDEIDMSVAKLSHFTQSGPDATVPPDGIELPEPGSAALLGLGMLGLLLRRRLRK